MNETNDAPYTSEGHPLHNIPARALLGMTEALKQIAEPLCIKAGLPLFRVMSPSCKTQAETAVLDEVILAAIDTIYISRKGKTFRWTSTKTPEGATAPFSQGWHPISLNVLGGLMGGYHHTALHYRLEKMRDAEAKT